MGLFKKDQKVRLRHLLQVGAKVEEYGISFYQGLAEDSGDEKVRALCRTLAEDETRHKAWIDEVLEQWDHLSMDVEIGLAMEQELRERGIFQKPGEAVAGDKALLAWAVDQEERMALFYLEHLDDLKTVWKKEQLEQMVREEEGHARRLRDLLGQ